jgi:hypothetical protein
VGEITRVWKAIRSLDDSWQSVEEAYRKAYADVLDTASSIFALTHKLDYLFTLTSLVKDDQDFLPGAKRGSYVLGPATSGLCLPSRDRELIVNPLYVARAWISLQAIVSEEEAAGQTVSVHHINRTFGKLHYPGKPPILNEKFMFYHTSDCKSKGQSTRLWLPFLQES